MNRLLTLRFLMFLLAATFACAGGNLRAENDWRFSPYDIHVWVAAGGAADLNDGLQQQVSQTLMQRTEANAGYVWNLTAASPPPVLRGAVSSQPTTVTVAEIESVDPKLLQRDKLILIGVNYRKGEFLVQARELDCHTRTWGPLRTRRTSQRRRIAREASLALADAFRPVIRITKTYVVVENEGQANEKPVTFARAQIRAGGLIVGDASLVLPPSGSALQPIIRRNNRQGKPFKNGIQTLPWTYMTVARRQSQSAELHCRVYSGMRRPLRRRSTRSTQQYALGVKTIADSTRLLVRSRPITPDGPSHPLGGYEVYARDPGSEKSKLLGITDWQGLLAVPHDGHPLRVLYIKSGGQPLARLPMTPGMEEEQTALVRDDRDRLRAEGIIKGVESNILDLVVRRKVLAKKIRSRIEKGNLDEAEKMLEKLRALPTADDMISLLNSAERNNLSSDPRQQQKIERLFKEIRSALGEHFDRQLALQLTNELARAKSALQ